ncbi:hypothetical protein [Candidatus Viridilinea mediisalina]|uniref:MarR family transcriptional regulator n=1 Tax=Candidatus Viridilinea mediisalina TaxID=2024553 RepID=A0A2A6RMN3_9CHLR|nr:hypothetical protein [Candidatus Viridilinea mediisalina]PDW04307.1 hypothetical protein CJ255_04480 [Candidatus Viridilinea mediisalina]
MVDPLVKELLEQAVDTPVKLQLLLMFHENPRMEATPQVIADRVCRDIWSVNQALYELAHDGIMLQAATANGDSVYRYGPTLEFQDAIDRLITGYDDPFTRDALHETLRNLMRHAIVYRPSDPWEPLVA